MKNNAKYSKYLQCLLFFSHLKFELCYSKYVSPKNVEEIAFINSCQSRKAPPQKEELTKNSANGKANKNRWAAILQRR